MRKTGAVLLLVVAMMAIAMAQIYAQESTGGGESDCRENNAVIAELLGIDETALEEALNNGQSIGELAEENGLSSAAVAEALMDNLKACEIARIDAMGAEMMCGVVDGPRMFDNVRVEHRSRWDMLAAETLGVDIEEVVNRMGSIAELAEANDSSADEVIQAIVDELSEQIYNQVSRNRLTQEEADEQLATLQDAVTEYVNAPSPNVQMVSLLDTAQETLGLSGADFYQGLTAGKTLAELAEENNVSVDDLSAALVDGATANIEAAQASGRLSDCVAEIRLGRVAELVDAFINQPNPQDDAFMGRSGILRGDFGFSFGFPGGDMHGFMFPDIPGMLQIPGLEWGFIEPGGDLDRWQEELDHLMPPNMPGMPGRGEFCIQIQPGRGNQGEGRRGNRGEGRQGEGFQWGDCDDVTDEPESTAPSAEGAST